MSEAHGMMQAAAGYYVHFEKRERGMLVSGYFPARDEPPIAELEDAWKLAERWARVNPARFVNVYVISALDFVPVAGYDAKKLNRYPPAEAAGGPQEQA